MDGKELTPGERYDLLCDDLTDVAVWLTSRHPAESYIFTVDFYHHQKCKKEIAFVVILGREQEKRRAIRATAAQALQALGWRIAPVRGGDVLNEYPRPITDLSAHQRICAIRRVQTALDQSNQDD